MDGDVVVEIVLPVKSNSDVDCSYSVVLVFFIRAEAENGTEISYAKVYAVVGSRHAVVGRCGTAHGRGKGKGHLGGGIKSYAGRVCGKG